MSLNNFIGKGRLTHEPELKTTQSGTPVTTFRIAIRRDYKPGSDPETDFFDCVAWRNTAEFITRYFRKGQEIIVEGSLQNRSWTAKDGSKRTVTEIIVDKTDFCGKVDYSENGQTAHNASNSPADGRNELDKHNTYEHTNIELQPQNDVPAPVYSDVGDDEDLPF